MSTLLKDRPLGKILAGVLLMGLGLACLVFVVFNLAKDIPIWLLGRHTVAEVVDVGYEQAGGEGGPTIRYFVRYQFKTSDGQVVTGTSSVGPEEWVGLGMGGPVDAVYLEQEHIPPFTVSGLEKGGSVVVVYFPPYPAHNRLDESPFVPILACAYLPFALMSGVGLVAGWRLIQPTHTRTRIWPLSRR